MAELHANQIAYKAPDTAKAQVARPVDYISDSLIRLGKVATDASETVAAYKDAELKGRLTDVSEKHKYIIDNAKSLNANYDELADKAIEDYTQALYSYDEATITRFLRNNPNAIDEFSIAVKTKTNEKRQNQIYNRSKLDIAQWSTQIVNAPKQYQNALIEDKRKDIQNLGLTMEQTDNLLFDLQSEIDRYQIAYLIANKEFTEARKVLKEELPTIGASARAYYNSQLQSAIEEDLRQKAQLEKEKMEAIENGVDPRISTLLSYHQNTLALGNIEGAKEIRDKFYYGSDILLGFDSDNKPIILHSSDIPAVYRDKLYAQMKTSADRAPALSTKLADYRADFNRLAFERMSEDGTLADSDEALNPNVYSLAKKLYDDQVGFNSLTKEEQTFVRNIVRNHGEGMVDSLAYNPDAKFATRTLTSTYTKANPIVNIAALKELYSKDPWSPYTYLNEFGETYTGREAESFNKYTEKFKDTYYNGDYELKRGTRANAIVDLIALIAYPYSNEKSKVGIMFNSSEDLLEELYSYSQELFEKGLYDEEAQIDTMKEDFKVIYKNLTGYDFSDADKEISDNLAIDIALAYVASKGKDNKSRDNEKFKDKLPKDDSKEALTIKLYEKDTGNIYPINSRFELEEKRRKGEL